MKVIKTKKVVGSDIAKGEFNNCEHLMVQLTPGEWQTISCKLPNGKFVTFAFVPGKVGTPEFECVDLHTTVGTPDEEGRYPQYLVGFRCGSNTFDSRKCKEVTTLATLLLGDDHYTTKKLE